MEDYLPNAEIMFPVSASGINQSGTIGIPDVGAIVFVEFLNQDANYPLVVGMTINSVPGFGKAVFNKMMRKKKYTKHIIKNGVAEIALDENGSIDITVQSMEGSAEDNGSMKEARITIDRSNCNNRIVLDADDIVLNCRNLLIKDFNCQIDSGNKTIIHGRGGRVAIESPSVFISANNGQGTNAVVIKGSSGTVAV